MLAGYLTAERGLGWLALATTSGRARAHACRRWPPARGRRRTHARDPLRRLVPEQHRGDHLRVRKDAGRFCFRRLRVAAASASTVPVWKPPHSPRCRNSSLVRPMPMARRPRGWAARTGGSHHEQVPGTSLRWRFERDSVDGRQSPRAWGARRTSESDPLGRDRAAVVLAGTMGAGTAVAAPPATTFVELSTEFAAGGTVVLGADIAQTGQVLDVGAGKSVTLDLAGHSLSVTGVPAGNAAIGVFTGAELIIEDTGGGGTLIATGGTGGRHRRRRRHGRHLHVHPGRLGCRRRRRRRGHRHRRRWPPWRQRRDSRPGWRNRRVRRVCRRHGSARHRRDRRNRRQRRHCCCRRRRRCRRHIRPPVSVVSLSAAPAVPAASR